MLTIVSAAATAERPQWIVRLDELHLLTPLRIVAIIVVALVATRLVRVVVGRLLQRTFGLPRIDKVRAGARQRALTSALRSALLGLVWAAAVITIISEVGVNIGAFVATATVVGGAVAFGAQTLVRDLIAGFFVLAEDQYGAGDIVDVGLASGVVEQITLRSVRLRDSQGQIWYVPHGGVNRVGNLSKATSVLLDVEVGRASKLDDLHRATSEMAEALTERAGSVMSGSPTVVGLVEMTDDRLVYRVSAPIRPGKQSDVRGAWRVLVLEAFDRGDLIGPADQAAAASARQGGPKGVEPVGPSITEPS